MTMLVREVDIRYEVGTAINRRHLAKLRIYATVTRVVFAGVFVLAAAILVLPRGWPESQSDKVRLLVHRYAYEAFPQWAIDHIDAHCPKSLDELSPLLQRESSLDAWGTPLEMRCGEPIRGAYIRSAGPDGRFETSDDITSND